VSAELNELADGWVECVIEDVVGKGGIFKDGDWVESKDQDPNGDVRLIQLADIGDGRFLDKSSRFLTRSKARELNCTFLRAGDILVARMPDPLGRCCIFPLDEDGRYVTVVDICAIRFGDSRVNAKFMMYLINSPSIRGKISALQSGSTRKRISRGNLATIPLPLPPLNEQHRIVAKIETLFSELDKGIESLKTAREQLKVYRQAVLKHAFEGKLTAKWREQNKDKLKTPQQLLARIQQERQARYQKQLENWQANVNVWETNGKEGKKPGRPRLINALKISAERDFEVPAEWGLLELGALAHESILGKMLDKAKNSGLARPYLGNINVRWGTFNLDNLKSMKIEESEVERYSLESGDIVICEGGEPGRCAVWQNTGTPVFIQKALHRVRFTESYSSRFAFYYLTYSTPLERVVKHFTGTTIKHLTGTGLNKVQFPVCSLEEQIEIVDILEGKLSLIESLESEIYSQLKKSGTLRQSILKKAFSGKLVPQDPNDEPASALLARVQSENATHAVSTSKTTNKKLAKPRNKEVRDD